MESNQAMAAALEGHSSFACNAQEFLSDFPRLHNWIGWIHRALAAHGIPLFACSLRGFLSRPAKYHPCCGRCPKDPRNGEAWQSISGAFVCHYDSPFNSRGVEYLSAEYLPLLCPTIEASKQ